MCIMFTDNFSKMIAHYENLLTWYDTYIWTPLSALTTNTKYQLKLWIYIFVIILTYLFWRGTWSIWWTGPTGRKNPECNSKRYQHTRVKFELAAPNSNLMKNNRITAKEQDQEKLVKLCSERKACRQKWLAICLSGRRMCITYMGLMFKQLG